MIHEKTLKVKILWEIPFEFLNILFKTTLSILLFAFVLNFLSYFTNLKILL